MSDESKGTKLAQERMIRAQAIARAGGIELALVSGALPQRIDTTVSELIVLGLLRQNVRNYIGVFGHGSTEVGEVLRVYQQAGLVRTFNVRSELEASHAATALRWVTGEKSAVFTSIGPGALQAFAGSLVPASDGIGVWYLFGDQPTEDEGPVLQQIPKHEQSTYLQMCATMGRAYTLHTPLAISTALRRGMNTVDHPHRAGPFFLLMPMNTQPATVSNFNLDELPSGKIPRLAAAADDDGLYEQAVDALMSAQKVVVRVGGGARGTGPELAEFLELVDGVAVVSPVASGVVPYDHPRNMTVSGTMGSISGNYAMENADLLVAIGTRFVCLSDSSRTAYPNAQRVININTDPDAATHYGRAIAMVGDAGPTLQALNEMLTARGAKVQAPPSPWMAACAAKRQEWEVFKAERHSHPTLYDPVWGKKVLTQPAAIKVATDWARANDAVCFFDAGDVQGNGLQTVEDDRWGRTFTDTGASYMGFAVSSLLATAIAEKPFYGLALAGDGSFVMCPQILIDGIQHGARGCILVLDNRRMGTISALQVAQYGADHATNDSVDIDYVAWGRAIKGVNAMDGGRSPASLRAALDRAKAYEGLSLIHLPVYWGQHEMGGLGLYGRWNVGNWCDKTQSLRHQIGL